MGAPHRTALALLAAAIALWAAALVFTLTRAEPLGSDVVAVFAPTVDGRAILAAVARADGRLVRGTWWPGAVVVHGEDAALADRLRGVGAWAVLPAAPLRFAMAGGCGFTAVPAARAPGEAAAD